MAPIILRRFVRVGFPGLLAFLLLHCAAGEEIDLDAVHEAGKKTTKAGAGGSLAAGGSSGVVTSGGDPGAGGGSAGDVSSAGGQGGGAEGGAAGATPTDSGASGGSVADVITYDVAPCPTCALNVQYSMQKADDPTQEIAFNVVIKNSASNIVHVNQIAVRYWYTIDGEASQEFAIDYSKPQGAAVQFVKVMPARRRRLLCRDQALRRAGSGHGSNRRDQHADSQGRYQGTYKQNDDYSFGAGHSAFGDSPKITAYIAGTTTPVWGTEPQ